MIKNSVKQGDSMEIIEEENDMPSIDMSFFTSTDFLTNVNNANEGSPYIPPNNDVSYPYNLPPEENNLYPNDFPSNNITSNQSSIYGRYVYDPNTNNVYVDDYGNPLQYDDEGFVKDSYGEYVTDENGNLWNINKGFVQQQSYSNELAPNDYEQSITYDERDIPPYPPIDYDFSPEDIPLPEDIHTPNDFPMSYETEYPNNSCEPAPQPAPAPQMTGDDIIPDTEDTREEGSSTLNLWGNGDTTKIETSSLFDEIELSPGDISHIGTEYSINEKGQTIKEDVFELTNKDEFYERLFQEKQVDISFHAYSIEQYKEELKAKTPNLIAKLSTNEETNEQSVNVMAIGDKGKEEIPLTPNESKNLTNLANELIEEIDRQKAKIARKENIEYDT